MPMGACSRAMRKRSSLSSRAVRASVRPRLSLVSVSLEAALPSEAEMTWPMTSRVWASRSPKVRALADRTVRVPTARFRW